MKSKHHTTVEILEARIAPASVTYIDLDGDLVKITASTGPLNAGDLVFRDGDPDGQLATLTLTDPLFAGANITFAATKKPGGDGFAHVGYINAAGVDLGTVVVKGDLGRIDAGNGDPARPAMKSLAVQSLGRFGLSTQELGTGDLVSTFAGRLGALVVKGDFVGARVETTGGAAGSIGAITIGGSLIGGDLLRTGTIESSGDMGAVKIGRDLLGGRGNESGKLLSQGKLASLTIGGSILGGPGIYLLIGDDRGQVHSDGDAGPIKISGDLRGGGERHSGSFGIKGNLTSLTIGGSLVGGEGSQSGIIDVGGDVGTVRIGGSVVGNGFSSATIIVYGTLASVTIGGSVIGGNEEQSGSIVIVEGMGAAKIGGDLIGGGGTQSGRINVIGDVGTLRIGGSVVGNGISSAMIIVDGTLASVTIGGSVIGGNGEESGSIVIVEGMGAAKIGGDLIGGGGPFAGVVRDISSDAVAGTLGSLTIGGSVRGGRASTTGAIIFEGAIGQVKIGGNLEGSSIKTGERSQTGYLQGQRIAGVFIGGSILAGFDLSSSGDLIQNASIRADHDIGAITIKGSLVGTEAIGGLTQVVISARGQAVLAPGAMSDLAIKSLSIGGQVSLAKVLAGFDPNDADNAGSNGNASIGAVTVGGDWYASSISAGVNAGSFGFGFDSDTVIDNPPGAAADAILARIASITIKGAVIGAPNFLFQTGFVAQQIGAFKAAGFTALLTAGTDAQILLTPFTLNVALLEA